MIFEFYPWKIDVDIEKTKQFYQENDYSSNNKWNKMFMDTLNSTHQEFFENLGIDLSSIERIETDVLVTYDGLGLLGTGIRFKHPATHFTESLFEEWDCGFVNGSLIVRGK